MSDGEYMHANALSEASNAHEIDHRLLDVLIADARRAARLRPRGVGTTRLEEAIEQVRSGEG